MQLNKGKELREKLFVYSKCWFSVSKSPKKETNFNVILAETLSKLKVDVQTLKSSTAESKYKVRVSERLWPNRKERKLGHFQPGTRRLRYFYMISKL